MVTNAYQHPLVVFILITLNNGPLLVTNSSRIILLIVFSSRCALQLFITAVN